MTTTVKTHPVIVIDPGHSGRSIRHRNKATGLIDFDYPNDPEMYEVFGISTCVAMGLRKIGYRVVLTKKTATSTVSLSRRAQIADAAGAALAVSVHDDHSQTATFQAVYSQRGVKHNGAYHAMWRGSGATYTVFHHPQVARRSARDARLIAQARTAAQHRPVQITEENFSGRAGLEPGNLALVQLLSDVPWVYAEAGALTDGSTAAWMSLSDRTGYAEGLLTGIVAAVPLPAARPESRAAVRQCLIAHRSG
ncbi:MAG: N-acetylmuramoyl-L-alanine amidase [Microlunatus sp.]|nr:N-acetylmuramoyl-L-alanine amidase [Microlunatus sp.]